MGALEGVLGLLIDVDGTLLNGPAAIPGAAEALEGLRSRGIPFRLTTNTTRRPRSAVARVLGDAGIRVATEDLLVPATLARRRILDSGKGRRAALLVPESCHEEFRGITPDESRPDWVVVGDLGREFTFDRLNRAFSCLRRGAGFIALQKGRWWRDGSSSKEMIDAGAFVAALEYAARVEAELVGKPALSFFRLALEDLRLPAGKVLVVGDDLENDVGGGAAAGCRTALVRTGKFQGREPRPGEPQPDRILDAIQGLLA
jgi:HAD superfamily hydrolase (TIGR01458 family)